MIERARFIRRLNFVCTMKCRRALHQYMNPQNWKQWDTARFMQMCVTYSQKHGNYYLKNLPYQVILAKQLNGVR